MKNDYPIYVRWLEIIEWLMARTERFPKHLRFSLSQKIDNLCIEILELIVCTIYQKSKRETLVRINLKLEVLRALLQLVYKTKRLSENQFVFISRELLEVGKMIGGWLKSLATETH